MTTHNSAKTDRTPHETPLLSPRSQDFSLRFYKAVIIRTWPLLFPEGRIRPLKRGIFHDMMASPEAEHLNITPAELKMMLSLLKATYPYRKELAKTRSARWDLEGNAVELVSIRIRARAALEVRVVAKQRAVKLRSVVRQYACLMNRASINTAHAWMNECDERDHLYMAVTHRTYWGKTAQLHVDFSRLLLKCPRDTREAFTTKMWEVLGEAVKTIRLYHLIDISLVQKENGGMFDGLNELATYTLVERLYRHVNRLFLLHDPERMRREAGIFPPASNWRRELKIEW